MQVAQIDSNSQNSDHKPSVAVEQPLNNKLSFFQSLKQYQPTARLVRLIFCWWLLLIAVTAIDMTDGFGIDALEFISTSTDNLYVLCALILSIGLLVTLIDVICLVALSKSNSYSLKRQHPSNVSVFHQFDIESYLSYTSNLNQLSNKPSFKDRFIQLILYSLLNNRLIKTITLDFYDDYPDHLVLVEAIGSNAYAMPITLTMQLDKNSQSNKSLQSTNEGDDNFASITQIIYPVMAIKRGTGYFGSPFFRVWSPLKLFRRQFKLEYSQNSQYLRVLADFSGLLSNQLSAVFEHSTNIGLQSILQQGQGSDFLKLREYTPGDAIRQIDWKASSRQRRLMSRSYEEDNDQDVIFLLDCGEQMRHYDISMSQDANHQSIDNRILNDIEQHSYQASYFDKVLNAVLLLSYVANKQNDRVGLMTFAGDSIYLPPKKGSALIRNLLNDTADIHPTMLTSDYVIAAQQLTKRIQKRSLIILVTNTRSEASEALTQALQLLSKRHQVVFANLMEQTVHDRLYGNSMPKNLDDTLLYHSLVSYQQERAKLHQNLSKKTGALCLQTTANQLPLKLTQAYLSIKK